MIKDTYPAEIRGDFPYVSDNYSAAESLFVSSLLAESKEIVFPHHRRKLIPHPSRGGQ